MKESDAKAQEQIDAAGSEGVKIPAEDVPLPESTTLDTARRFLQADEVTREISREKKVEFLKSKGISEQDIATLLGEGSEGTWGEAGTESDHKTTSSEPLSPQPDSQKKDHPPVITYPEYLAKPSRPPPLVTANRLLNAVYGFAGLSSLVYGTSKLAIEPMVRSLTEARVSIHETVADRLASMIEKLEGSVSAVPFKSTRPRRDSDDGSDYEDPTELFHRDFGTQTSVPSSPTAPSTVLSTLPTITHQTKQLSQLAASLKAVEDSFTSQSEELADIQLNLSTFRDELDSMIPVYGTFQGGYLLPGSPKVHEPDDEIKKAKDNIRRVKGVLLSSRNFPVSPR